MAVDAHQIARRIAALAPDARRDFLRKLEARGLAFGELPIVAADRTSPLPLSVAQRSLWLAWRLAPASSAYNMPGALRLDGPLDEIALQAALDALVERHEVLRTRLPADASGEPFQDLLPARGLALEHFADGDEAEQRAFAARPFRLDAEPPLRAALFRHGEASHTLLLVLHHVAGDGWSVRVLVDDLLALYAAHCRDLTPDLPPLPIQFADYAAWQRQWLEAGEAARQLEGWRERLGNEHPELSLPLARARREDMPSPEGRHRFALPDAVAADLKRWAHGQGASIYMAMLALFGLLLYRHTGQDDLRIGSPVANRRRAETHGLVGYLTNLQVLRLRIDPRTDGHALLASVREAVLDAQSRQDVPFDQLVEALAPPRRPGVHPLIQVKCTRQDDVPPPREVAGLRVRLDELSGGQSRFDLSFDFVDTPAGLRAELAYASALFDADAIARMADGLQALATRLADDPATPLAALGLPSPWATLVGESPSSPAPDVLVPWHAFADASPHTLAVRDEHTAWTRGELSARVRRLAARLQAAGVAPGARVAVHAERCCAFVLGALACLEAGATYVPLDPKLPAARLAAQLADSGATMLLSDLAPAWATATPRLALTDDVSPDAPFVAPAIHAALSAYLIYTSGSTGGAKGVVVSRGALANYVRAVLDRLDLPPDAASFAMVSTVAADLGHTSFFGALCSGRALHLIDAERAFDPDRFAQYMATHRIDVLKLVPSHLQALLQAARPEDVLPRRCLVLGGEASSWALVDRIAALRPECRVLNHYGPTETTVGVLTQGAGTADREAAILPLGSPLAGIEALVLDAELNPVPYGCAGELYLGGTGLAQGYTARPGLTAERFVAHPHGGGGRVYRSGDRVRQRPDGNLEFVGRADDQVKIRGHRVEPGEVRAALLEMDDVQDAAVVVRPGLEGRAELHAYVVAPTHARSAERLRTELAGGLAEPMLPSSFTFLDALPLTPNGKVDRRALPEPEVASALREPPRGETECALAAIWSEVLGVAAVGRDDNFFGLGGDSILSLKVVARARKRGLALQPRQLMGSPSLRTLAETLEATTPSQELPPPAARPAGPLPLSSAQARQWFLWKLDPAGAAYHVAGALILRGRLDVAALRAAFETLVARHEALRTVFLPTPDGLAEQRIEPPGAFQVTSIDLEGDLGRADAETARLVRTPFNLTTGPLLRVALLRLAEGEHRLVVVLHHIVADGWSMQLVVDEFATLYAACAGGEAIDPTLAPRQYADHALAQRRWLASPERDAELAWWREQLGTEHPVQHLPTDHPRRPDGLARAARLDLTVPDDLAAALRHRAQAEGATLFMLLLAGWQALLARWSGQHDVRVGVPIANRHRPDDAGVVGLFVNTQVLRAMLEPRASLTRVLRQVREAALGAQAHQDLPFDQLVEALAPERDLGGSPLFQVLFNHQRKDHARLRTLPGLALTDLPLPDDAAQFELALDTSEWDDGRLRASFTFAAGLFEPDTIARLARHYLRLLRAFAEMPHRAWNEVDLLDDDERARLAAWGHDTRRFDAGTPVHRRFEEQARRAPQAAALVFGELTLSYAELDARANRLAHRLVALGARPDDRIGVALERGPAMIVGVLATLKAGAAYVPLDPQYPAERLAHMIEDAGVTLLLADAGFRAPSDATLHLVDPANPGLECEPAHAPEVALHGDQLAYVIYTSGSTGRPKGIALSHAVLAEHTQVAIGYFGLGPGERVLQFSTINFDGFVEQLFPALACGAAVVLRGPQLWEAEAFRREVVARGVTVADLPTAYWHLLAREFAGRPAQDWGALRQVHATGETMPVEGLRAWRAAGLGRIRLLNTYGPTESAVTATTHDCAAHLAPAAAMPHHVPIGRPLGGRRLHVLDAALQAAPAGVVGELYIGGALLARGYHGRAALSAERFVADPFDAAGGRLYRTGDLARWNAHGELEYLGRVDHQVKVRGYRIELGEIEARLQAQPGVREALVVDQRDGADVRLVGYACGESLASEALRAGLARVLPEYMVPAVVVVLDAPPMTPNGKLDRKRLPRIGFAERGHETPHGATEEALAEIWAELLGVTRIGRDDHFFELGGHSLRAVQLISRVRDRAGIELALRTVFERPRLRELAQAIDAGRSADEIVPRAVDRDARLPLSPAQARLWLVDRLTPEHERAGLAAYNMHAALRLEGHLDATTLHRALAAIVERHELLRTGYVEDEDGEVAAIVSARASIALPLTDLAGVSPEARQAWIARATAEDAAQGFDLRAPPLLRASLLRLAEDEHLLLLCVHHIAFDGWSQSVFIDELAALYPAFVRGDASPLAPLPLQYADYADWHARTLAATRERDAAFWRAELADAPATSSLPPDAGREGTAERSAGELALTLDTDLAAGLSDLARAHGSSLFTLLHAAFALWLQAESASDDVVIGTDVAGRSRREFEPLLGFFVNVVPLRSRRAPGLAFADWLAQAKERDLRAFAHAERPFDQVVEMLGLPRRRVHAPLVQVLFVMQNVPERRLELPDLRVEILDQPTTHAKFDLAVFVGEQAGALQVRWVFADGRYSSARIERAAAGWTALLRRIALDPRASLDALLDGLPTSLLAPSAAMNSQPRASKLDKLARAAAPRPRARTRTSFLSAGREFPLVIEAESRELDPVAWAREQRDFIDTALCRHGGVLFRGFGLETPQDFEAFAEVVEPGLYGQYGDLPKKEGGRNLYRSTPYPEREMILFHNESAHLERWPRKQWFFCELPSPVGGATPIVDGREMLRRLPTAIAGEFARKGLLYVRTFTPRLDVDWRDFYKTDDRDALMARLRAAGTEARWLDEHTLQTRTRCPAVITHPVTGERVFFNQVQLHHPSCLEPQGRADLVALVGADRLPRQVFFGDGSPIADETMAEVGRAYEACAVRFDWRRGDVVMLDNMIAAHARDPYEGPRKIVVAMGAMFDRADLERPAVARGDTHPELQG